MNKISRAWKRLLKKMGLMTIREHMALHNLMRTYCTTRVDKIQGQINRECEWSARLCRNVGELQGRMVRIGIEKPYGQPTMKDPLGQHITFGLRVYNLLGNNPDNVELYKLSCANLAHELRLGPQKSPLVEYVPQPDKETP